MEVWKAKTLNALRLKCEVDMKCLKQHLDKQLHRAQCKERNPSASGQTPTISQRQQEETFLELFFRQSMEFFPTIPGSGWSLML